MQETLRSFVAVFSNRSLRRLQLAGVGSTLGMWAYGVGIAVYAYHAGGARAVGILFAARWGAGAIAAPWLSVLADRGSRRQVMLAADLSRAAIIGAIAALAFLHASYAPVFVLAVIATMTSSIFAPAQGALLPTLVDTP